MGVGRTTDDGRVHDCPACGGWFATDEWHVSAVVRDAGRDGGRETYLFCDDDCLDGWLALFDGPTSSADRPAVE